MFPGMIIWSRFLTSSQEWLVSSGADWGAGTGQQNKARPDTNNQTECHNSHTVTGNTGILSQQAQSSYNPLIWIFGRINITASQRQQQPQKCIDFNNVNNKQNQYVTIGRVGRHQIYIATAVSDLLLRLSRDNTRYVNTELKFTLFRCALLIPASKLRTF